jgi:hypothetical protein
MKNTIRILVITALVAVIGFSFVTCSNSSGGGGGSTTPGNVRKVEFNSKASGSDKERAVGYTDDGSLTFFLTGDTMPGNHVCIYYVYADNITSVPQQGLSGSASLEAWLYTNGQELNQIGTGITNEATFASNFSSIPTLSYANNTVTINLSQFRQVK